MPNYKFNLEYNGANFNGSQIQEDNSVRTVQGVLEDKLSSFLKEDIDTTFSGRTDAGVHAVGQVINFKTQNSLDLIPGNHDKLLLSLNSQLPDDLVLTKVEEVSDDFHARFAAKTREYSYKIFIRRHRPVLRLDSLAWVKEPLDFDAMQAHCKSLLGTQDFSRYAKLEPGKEDDVVCTVEKAELIKESKICFKFHIKANRFLRHMVRRIVGELIFIGKGGKAEDMSKAHSAPPEGLTLLKVSY